MRCGKGLSSEVICCSILGLTTCLVSVTITSDSIYSREERCIVTHDFSHHGKVDMAVIMVAGMCADSNSIMGELRSRE